KKLINVLLAQGGAQLPAHVGAYHRCHHQLAWFVFDRFKHCEARPMVQELRADKHGSMPDRVDLFWKRQRRRIQVAKQFMSDREVLSDSALQILRADVRILKRREEVKRRQSVEWNLLVTGNIGFSEKEALVII